MLTGPSERSVRGLLRGRLDSEVSSPPQQVFVEVGAGICIGVETSMRESLDEAEGAHCRTGRPEIALDLLDGTADCSWKPCGHGAQLETAQEELRAISARFPVLQAVRELQRGTAGLCPGGCQGGSSEYYLRFPRQPLRGMERATIISRSRTAKSI